MHTSSQPNDSIHGADIEELTKTRSNESSLFSLFLGPAGDPVERFDNLLGQLEKRRNLDLSSAEEKEQWRAESSRIRQWLEANWQQGQGIALFSSAPTGLWQAFRLPAPVCDRLVVSDRLYVRPLEILVAESKSGKDQQVEAQRVEEMITRGKKGQGAVLGPEQTFLAVRAKTVRLLVVEEGFCLPGGVCPNCGFLSADQRGVCLLCGMALHPEPDLIEVALQSVLDAGGEIEIVRSAESRRALEPYGRIGGLVRTEGKPTEKDTANRLPFEKEGKTDWDVLQDETVEESFPASDPPG